MMNKVAFSFTLLTVCALIVRGADPEMPRRKVCSIQGKGRVIHDFDTESFKGTFIMYRVNGVVLYNFTAFDEDAKEIEGYLTIRPDLKKTSYFVTGDHYGHGVHEEDVYPLSRYQYSEDFKPVSGMDYYCFMYGLRNAAMLFSPDKKMDLVGEFFDWGSKKRPESLTFLYDEVKQFEHEEVDDLFSLKGSYDDDLAKEAPGAITSKCDSSSIVVAMPLLVVAAVVLSLLF